jgi:DNA invertase Pin-like site-specific DNA recombinase
MAPFTAWATSIGESLAELMAPWREIETNRGPVADRHDEATRVGALGVVMLTYHIDYVIPHNGRCENVREAMRYIAYLRVSTDKQGRSGLGLEAQREAVASYLRNKPGAVLVTEYVEVESGKRRDRPELAKALASCRGHRAALVVAKLDRLARDARFLLTVLDGAPADCGVVFCDLPTVPEGPVGRFLVSQMAAVAELEAGLIGQRTKAALAAAKARGVTLGGYRGGPVPSDADRAKAAVAHSRKATERAADLAPVISQLRQEGVGSLGALAAALNGRGVPSARGGRWTATAVRRVVARSDLI